MQAADKDRSGALDLTEFVSMFDKLFGWTGNVKVRNILGSCYMIMQLTCIVTIQYSYIIGYQSNLLINLALPDPLHTGAY